MLAAALAATTTLGCAAHTARIGPDAGVPHDATRERAIQSSACGFNLGGLIGTNTPTMYQRAMADLRSQAPFDYVTDIEMLVYWRYAVIGTRHCVLLRARTFPKDQS